MHSAGAAGEQRLRLRMAELSPAAQAALLRLDPIADREEHAELDALLAEGTMPTVAALLSSPRPDAQRLGLRARNLGVERFGLWSGSQSGSLFDVIDDPTARCVVVDLGSLGTREEQALVAGEVLGRLWERREEREPVLIVIDEAHNVCPARPEDRLTALATEHAVRIAAEGRKFACTWWSRRSAPEGPRERHLAVRQPRPDAASTRPRTPRSPRRVFSFVPPSLIGQAATFGLGEALVAGKISQHPALLRFGARVAEEGGSDVPSSGRWAPEAEGSS